MPEVVVAVVAAGVVVVAAGVGVGGCGAEGVASAESDELIPCWEKKLVRLSTMVESQRR
jgi:hypothetical protein